MEDREFLEDKEDYKVLRWLGSLPMFLIGSALGYFLLGRGPLVQWFVDEPNGSPIMVKEINGVLSFIYVVVVRTIMHLSGLIFASFVAASPVKFISRLSWVYVILALLNMALFEFFDFSVVSDGSDPVYAWTGLSLGLIYGVGGLYFVKWIKD